MRSTSKGAHSATLLLFGCLAIAALNGCAARSKPVVADDAMLVVRVKTALVNDRDLGTRLVAVYASDGVVRLVGTVHSAVEADRAVALVRGVAGVRDVKSELVVSPPSENPADPGSGARQTDSLELDDGPRLLALGIRVRRTDPRGQHSSPGFDVGPLVRVGRGNGFGLTMGFGWFDLPVEGGDHVVQGRIKVRPLMAGAGYTFVRGRWSHSLTVVGGPSFNGYSLDAKAASEGVTVAVGRSAAVRPALSIWFDANRRIALNAFAGYLVTRPRTTLVEQGQLVERTLRADTAVMHVGVAYKVF